MSREFPSNHTQKNHLNLTSQFIQQIGRVDLTKQIQTAGSIHRLLVGGLDSWTHQAGSTQASESKQVNLRIILSI